MEAKMKEYSFAKLKAGQKREILKDLTGKWVKIKTTMEQYNAKGMLLGFEPEARDYIYVGIKLLPKSANHFMLTRTIKILLIVEIRVFSRKPGCVLDTKKKDHRKI